MGKKFEVYDPRRTFLLTALSSGLFVAGFGLGLSRKAIAMGKLSRELPAGKSIYKVSGDSRVDGKQATPETHIGAGATIETGTDGELIFAVGKDAFILRSNSTLKLGGNNLLVDTLHLFTGKLLSVFGKTTHTITTTVATIGIRGTGVYLEADLEKTYICTCYGIADLSANNDPKSKETVKTRRHDAPRYILADGISGKRIVRAPVINHTESELMLVEQLVGRRTPFKIEYERRGGDGGDGDGDGGGGGGGGGNY